MTPMIFWPLGLSVLALVGAYLDTRFRKLPNWLAGALLLYGLAHGLATDELANLPWYLAHAVIALVIGMALFAGGVIGGGDGKFYAAIASYFILWDGLVLLLAVSVSGVVLVLLWFFSRPLRKKAKASDNPDMAKFPYGIAIAAGAIVAAFLPV